MSLSHIKEILTTPSIGLFKCIELFEIIGIKDKEPPFNIFTLAVAQELDLHLINEEKITSSLVQLKKDKSLKFGIFKSILSIDDFLNRASNLDNGQWENSQQEPLSCGKLRSIPNVYVPALEEGKNEFLGLLKNNFFGGSHLFEWFDETKEYVQGLMENHLALMELSEELQEYLPIKIGIHSDRLGNFIIQIPCSSVAFQIKRRDKESHQLISNLSINPSIESLSLTGIFWRENNGSITDFQKFPLALGENLIPFKQINGTGYYTIWDEDKQIICSGGIIRPYMEIMNFSIGVQETNQRVFNLPNGQEQRINISVRASQSQIGRVSKDYRDWVANRLIKFEKKELHESLKLRQFKQNMREEALAFIRELIRRYGTNGVYLWDPYLSAEDLLETMFFSPYVDTPIKVLTGLKNFKEHNIKTSYKNELEQAIIEKGWLNLIFLSADKSKAGDFHDRFIIFPRNQDNPARAWSLGTSVNSLGKSYHIIQEVEDGQIIADAFEEMWKQSIVNEENIIWKSKNN
ncbi:VPA1262 family N-terminal domain-containing protein [Avibacterium endocarditidis]|uniref:VPA1262 family N-terminal domain-containing protein n=1 Tax=Avibacterium TaxID=292486 RepID=UPI0039FD77B5